MENVESLNQEKSEEVGAGFKVVIVAAGIGSRMQPFTNVLNKALIPINGKPAICHIIEKFDSSVEIVVAVGYLKESLMTYLLSAYPKRKITFVELAEWGAGTGPGYSLLACRSHLECPFIFLSADTLVSEKIPAPSNNYFGVAKVSDTSRFCSVKVDDESGKVVRIDDKVACDNKDAFIGLMGVKDYELFWEALSGNKDLIGEEIQISNGSVSLMESSDGMKAEIFTWFDVGVPEAYKYTLANYPNGSGYTGE